MSDEINALLANFTWTLVPKLCNANIIYSKWIYKIQHTSDGSIECYKERLVSQGFTQLDRLDVLLTAGAENLCCSSRSIVLLFISFRIAQLALVLAECTAILYVFAILVRCCFRLLAGGN